MRLIGARISILQLAKELANIQKACKATGIARSGYYEIKRAYEPLSRSGMVETKRGKKAQPIVTDGAELIIQFTSDNSKCPTFGCPGRSSLLATATATASPSSR